MDLDRAKKGTKSTLNREGELAGIAATEALVGVATGVGHGEMNVGYIMPYVRKALPWGVVQVVGDAANRNSRLRFCLTNELAFHDALYVGRSVGITEDGARIVALGPEAGSGEYYEVRFIRIGRPWPNAVW